MPPVGFEPTMSVGERPQTYALDRSVMGPANVKYKIYFTGEITLLVAKIVNTEEMQHCIP